jgi:hypothetical protein
MHACAAWSVWRRQSEPSGDNCGSILSIDIVFELSACEVGCRNRSATQARSRNMIYYVAGAALAVLAALLAYLYVVVERVPTWTVHGTHVVVTGGSSGIGVCGRASRVMSSQLLSFSPSHPLTSTVHHHTVSSMCSLSFSFALSVRACCRSFYGRTAPAWRRTRDHHGAESRAAGGGDRNSDALQARCVSVWTARVLVSHLLVTSLLLSFVCVCVCVCVCVWYPHLCGKHTKARMRRVCLRMPGFLGLGV